MKDQKFYITKCKTKLNKMLNAIALRMAKAMYRIEMTAHTKVDEEAKVAEASKLAVEVAEAAVVDSKIMLDKRKEAKVAKTLATL